LQRESVHALAAFLPFVTDAHIDLGVDSALRHRSVISTWFYNHEAVFNGHCHHIPPTAGSDGSALPHSAPSVAISTGSGLTFNAVINQMLELHSS